MSNRADVGPADPAAAGGREHPAACTAVHAHPSKIARIRRHLLDARAGSALADIFKVLGDPTRVRMLDALAQSELCVCDLATLVGLSESAVSHQLRLLRNTRVVRARRTGRMVFYALDDQHVISLFEQGLRHVEETAPRDTAASPSRAAGRIPAAAARRRLQRVEAAKPL